MKRKLLPVFLTGPEKDVASLLRYSGKVYCVLETGEVLPEKFYADGLPEILDKVKLPTEYGWPNKPDKEIIADLKKPLREKGYSLEIREPYA